MKVEAISRIVVGLEKYDFVKDKMDTFRGTVDFYNLKKLSERGFDVDSLPYSIKVLLENALRFSGSVEGAGEAVEMLAKWPASVGEELPFKPYRILLQDYTGVPLIVDLASMRDAAGSRGLNPASVNSKVPVDLVIDHSIQVDMWGNDRSLLLNLQKEYERNSERYSLLKWAQSAFHGMRIFPPGMGICHQVNLEYLAKVAVLDVNGRASAAFPDTVLGTDSHTPMVNGLGVLGWGVGGIEAEAVMLGEPYYLTIPRVVGVKLTGSLVEGATPTDLVLKVTETLRSKNVVDAFVEYFGEGFMDLTVPDRATLGNMSPEYGATVGFSPVDESTIAYLLQTGRSPEYAEFVKQYCVKQGLFMQRGARDARYSEIVEIDLSKVEPSLAGPRNPEERIRLKDAPLYASKILEEYRRRTRAEGTSASPDSTSRSSSYASPIIEQSSSGGEKQILLRKPDAASNGVQDGSIVIAAITSCTNTSNPTVMIGSGLLAKNAVEHGLKTKPYVKASLAPGSIVVKDYLEESGLLQYLEMLGFNLVGYGCTTCIGNSGPLASAIEEEIKARDLYTLAVLSGNRNFDGRIHPLVKGSYLMSPMLVVAYALVGRIDFDFDEPLGSSSDGSKVYLRDIWPSMREIGEVVSRSLKADLYRNIYADPLEGDEKWRVLPSPVGDTYRWEECSTYIREPPWFSVEYGGFKETPIEGARVLAVFEDKVTTDHISPAGVILPRTPAGNYLQEQGVSAIQFSTYGSRRGNHEVMVRGGFANNRLRNVLAHGKEGGWTTFFPTGEVTTIYEASMRYKAERVPLIILAGKQYGAGSSRDWAAKAPRLLNVKAVIAESFERIHRSNLIAMGVLPLQFIEGEGWKKLGLTGGEVYTVEGIGAMKRPGEELKVTGRAENKEVSFNVVARIVNSTEMQYFSDGGVLPYVFKKTFAASK